MKYIVICYSIHDMTVASCDPFATEEAARTFMKEDARFVYEEEHQHDETAEYEDCGGIIYVSACNKSAEWTWQICLVNDAPAN